MVDPQIAAMPTVAFLRHVLLSIAATASMGAAYEQWGPEFSLSENKRVWTDSKSSLDKRLERRVTIKELQAVPVETLKELGFASWDKLGPVLIPLWVYNYIADGEYLTSIVGSAACKGTDEIDLDVRGGCIAWGFQNA